MSEFGNNREYSQKTIINRKFKTFVNNENKKIFRVYIFNGFLKNISFTFLISRKMNI